MPILDDFRDAEMNIIADFAERVKSAIMERRSSSFRSRMSSRRSGMSSIDMNEVVLPSQRKSTIRVGTTPASPRVKTFIEEEEEE